MNYAVMYLSAVATRIARLNAVDAAAAVENCERRGRDGASFELLSVLLLESPLARRTSASIHLPPDAAVRVPGQTPR
jgi:hypothetical protein